jgi:predicted NodU family carbamoyl transferase
MFGEGRRVRPLKEIHFPHSLGLLYSAFTYFTGFKVNSGEYKLMGLAPYGEPKYADLILRELMDLKEDGSFRLNMDYFNYGVGLTMTNANFERLFGGPARKPESRLTQRDMDLARSVQDVTEEVMFRMARHVRKETGKKDLCLAGGVALNCVANGRILRDGIFERIWIQPAAGDAGGALGAALFAWHQVLNNPRKADGELDVQHGSYLGPEFSRDEIRAFLTEIIQRSLEDPDRKGCLLVNSALDVAPHDAAIGKVVAAYLDEIRAFFRRNAEAARAAGHAPRRIDPEVVADHLLGVVLGIRVLARTGAKRGVLEGVARPALELLDLPLRSRGTRQTTRRRI